METEEEAFLASIRIRSRERDILEKIRLIIQESGLCCDVELGYLDFLINVHEQFLKGVIDEEKKNESREESEDV